MELRNTLDWKKIVSYLPSDLEESARTTGAFLRQRAIPNAHTLLRLLLVYCCTPLSFRQTTAWAEAQNLAYLSDVSLIERMERSEAWLLHLLSQMLPVIPKENKMPSIVLVDATSITAPNQDVWKLHVHYNAQQQSIQQILVADAHTAESFKNLPIEAGSLYLGDRAYGSLKEIQALLTQHGKILCRMKGRAYLQYADSNQLVTITTEQGRVIIAPIPQEKHAAIEKRLKRRASKKGHRLNLKTKEASKYLFLFCSDSSLSDAQAVELYRWRWQIELLFKRLKSLQGIDQMLVKSPVLCRVYLLCHCLVSLIAQRMQADIRQSFSPEAIEAAICLATLAIAV